MLTFVVTMQDGVTPALAILDEKISPAGLEAFLMAQADPWIRMRAKERFDGEGDDATGKWAPLKSATINIRQGLGYGGAHPINVRTGTMEEFLTTHRSVVWEESDGATLQYPGTIPGGELGAKLKRAQQGDTRAKARPVIGMSPTDTAAIMTRLERYILEGMS